MKGGGKVGEKIKPLAKLCYTHSGIWCQCDGDEIHCKKDPSIKKPWLKHFNEKNTLTIILNCYATDCIHNRYGKCNMPDLSMSNKGECPEYSKINFTGSDK